MKRKTTIITLLLFFAMAFFYLQTSREPTIDSVVTHSDSSGYVASLTITANKLVIFNQNKLQKNIISHILNNDFQNMLFSYDVMGYPKECTVIVYTNSLTKKLGISAFTFRYAPDCQMQSTLQVYTLELPQKYPQLNVVLQMRQICTPKYRKL